tara:strand:- start:107 stop:850 length:744 start_codon:yes stop_codon:yes gene_type:complete
MKSNEHEIFDKLLEDTKKSNSLKESTATSDKEYRDKIEGKIHDNTKYGGGNKPVQTMEQIFSGREEMKRPRYSLSEAYVQLEGGGQEVTDGHAKLFGDGEIKKPVSCKIGPITPIRHVCKSMQPFKWIPDPLQEMDNRAQYFEKSRKVHKCEDVIMNGTQGSNYSDTCAQAGIFTTPNDSHLKLREAYWDKTYSDPRRDYSKKINKMDKLFIENYLDPTTNPSSYKKQRDLKAQMVYEDEVRSYYQS